MAIVVTKLLGPLFVQGGNAFQIAGNLLSLRHLLNSIVRGSAMIEEATISNLLWTWSGPVALLLSKFWIILVTSETDSVMSLS